MSCPSEFIILRKYNNSIIPESQREFMYKKFMEDSLFSPNDYMTGNKLKDKDSWVAKYLPIPKGEEAISLYVNMTTGEVFEDIFNMHFITDFTTLKELWNMHSLNPQILINVETAKEIIQAIEYILSGNYSEQVENILKNNYISVFGEHYPLYLTRYDFGENKEIDSDWLRREKYYLNKAKCALSAFVWLMDENTLNEYKYDLLYCI